MKNTNTKTISLKPSRQGISSQSALVTETRVIDLTVRKLLNRDLDKKFHKLVDYQIETGGKRIRPLLAVLCFKMLGGNTNDIIYPAAALEIMHNYTLILDDIADESPLRRSRKTVWKKYGTPLACFVSMCYSSAVMHAIALSSEPNKVASLLGGTMTEIFDGQVTDLSMELVPRGTEKRVFRAKADIETCLGMMNRKTASMFEACCVVAGLCVKTTKKTQNELAKFGRSLGIAFQIQDDLLDIFGDKELGKEIGRDIYDGKVGNIVILSCLRESSKDKEVFHKILEKRKKNHADVAKVIQLIQKTDIPEKLHGLSESYLRDCRLILKKFRPNRYRFMLESLLDSISIRKS